MQELPYHIKIVIGSLMQYYIGCYEQVNVHNTYQGEGKIRKLITIVVHTWG